MGVAGLTVNIVSGFSMMPLLISDVPLLMKDVLTSTGTWAPFDSEVGGFWRQRLITAAGSQASSACSSPCEWEYQDLEGCRGVLELHRRRWRDVGGKLARRSCSLRSI